MKSKYHYTTKSLGFSLYVSSAVWNYTCRSLNVVCDLTTHTVLSAKMPASLLSSFPTATHFSWMRANKISSLQDPLHLKELIIPSFASPLNSAQTTIIAIMYFIIYVYHCLLSLTSLHKSQYLGC